MIEHISKYRKTFKLLNYPEYKEDHKAILEESNNVNNND